MKKKKNSKKAYIIYGVSSAVVICVLTLIAILSSDVDNKVRAPNDSRPDNTVVFGSNLIPSYQGLDIIMGKAVKDLYGGDYSDIMSYEYGETIQIPQTQITFNRIEVGDAIDTMAVTAMAFLRNPYAKSVDHPVPLQLLIEKTEGSVRVMPDGGTIDLAEVVQNYSNLKLLTNRYDPTKVTVTGYCNGDYFTESVDLMGLYEKYYVN